MEEVSILIMVLRKIKKLDDIGAKKIPRNKLRNKSNARIITITKRRMKFQLHPFPSSPTIAYSQTQPQKTKSHKPILRMSIVITMDRD